MVFVLFEFARVFFEYLVFGIGFVDLREVFFFGLGNVCFIYKFFFYVFFF